MKLILFTLFSLILITSCNKNKNDVLIPIGPKSFKDKIVLNNPQVAGDSVTLTWTQLDTSAFRQYIVWRREDSTNAGTQVGYIYDRTSTRFTDKNIPYTAYIEYEIRGVLSSGNVITSNKVTYKRPEIKLIDATPFDVIFSSQDHLLYFFEKNGDISQYSLLSHQVVKKISTAATIGYCDFGTFNGKKELYVPRNDGWVFVYDALTLDKIDQINVGLNSSCVVFNNNILFVSTSAWTNRPIKVYNRATKALVSETGDFDLTRFKKIPGSNTELLEITINIGPVDQDYYSFGSTGNIITHLNDRYHGDYPLDHRIFEFFPSGNKYITASEGAIYNRSMTFEATLPRGNLEFTTFDFDAVNGQIYAGTETKTVEVYTLDSYNHVRSIPTKAYPFKIFKDNTGIICVSSTTVPANYSNTPFKVIIEELK